MFRVFALILSFFVLSGPGWLRPVAADCPDGDSGNNVIVCSSDVVEGENNNDDQVDGGLGDDTITVNEGVTVDYVDGDGGDDDEGEDISGQGDGGDDLIINNGTATSGIYGDYVTGEGGNDTIINNGTTGYITGNDGDDLIINNGTVIDPDDADDGDIDAASGFATIVVNGRVDGEVYGDDDDDRIELHNGASGGDDNTLVLDGDYDDNDGDDTLVFSFVTDDADEYDDLVDQFAQAVLSTSQDGTGTLTFRGQTYEWLNFEQLLNLIRLIMAESGGSGEVIIGTRDGRLNWQDVAAPAAIYCAAEGGIVVYVIGAGGNGSLAASASSADINAAVAQGGTVVVTQAGGVTLYANGDGQLLVEFGGYTFGFGAAACAPSL